MTLALNFRRGLDNKRWEQLNSLPAATAAGASMIRAHGDPEQIVLYVVSATVAYLYYPKDDAWMQIPSPGLGGTFGAGACGCWNPNGPTGTTSAATNSTITTNFTALRSFAGYQMDITGGTGAGARVTIISNTVGANATFTVASWPVATPDATTTWRLRTGRFYVLSPGTLAATCWRYFDVATFAWTSLNITNLPATWGTEGNLVAPSLTQFSTGTASGGSTTKMIDAAKAWTAVNQWIGTQIRMTLGPAAGQVRTITASTAAPNAEVTVATWTGGVSVAAGNTYVIEANEDVIYLIGNNAATMYKYTISTATWSTASVTGGARGAAPGVSSYSAYSDSCTRADWTNENAILNGRRIISARGGASNVVDAYDIPTATWAVVTYWGATETITTGSSGAQTNDGRAFIQQNVTGRIFEFNPGDGTFTPWSIQPYPQSPAVTGDKLFIVTYTEGGTTLYFVYLALSTSSQFFRCLDI